MSQINARCPHCDKSYRLSAELVGKRAKCKACQKKFVIEPEKDSVLRKSKSVSTSSQIAVGPPSLLEGLSSDEDTPKKPQARIRGDVPPVSATMIAVHSPGPRPGSSLGVASIVLGILAFIICWIPFLNLLGIPLAGLGALLGGIGLVVALMRRGAGVGYPIAGLTISLLAISVTLTVTFAMGKAIESAGDEIKRDLERRRATNQTVVPTPEDSPPSATPDQSITAPGNSRESHEPAVTWAPSFSPVQQGEIQIRIVSVDKGKVPLTEVFSNGKTTSENELLAITIEILNRSETQKLNYQSWAGISFGDSASLTDNFGNLYKKVQFSASTKVTGAAGSDSIYPGKSIEDVVVFEEPIPKAEYVRLELPSRNVDGSGWFRIQIPCSTIKQR